MNIVHVGIANILFADEVVKRSLITFLHLSLQVRHFTSSNSIPRGHLIRNDFLIKKYGSTHEKQNVLVK